MKHFNLFLLFFLFLIVISIIGCNTVSTKKPASKVTPLSHQEQAYYDVIAAITDSVSNPYSDLPPPPKSKEFENDTIFKKALKKPFQFKKVALMNDSIYYDKYLAKKLAKRLMNEKLLSIDTPHVYKIDLSKIKSNKSHLTFEYFSKHTDNEDKYISKEIDEHRFAILFSNIQFNEKKNRGLLSCSYVCGKMCGAFYDVYIRKEGNRWVVDEIIQTGIA